MTLQTAGSDLGGRRVEDHAEYARRLNVDLLAGGFVFKAGCSHSFVAVAERAVDPSSVPSFFWMIQMSRLPL